MPKKNTTHKWDMSNHLVMPKPKNSDDYFEQMTRIAFASGLNWKMIENKWPNFKKAFANFSVKKVVKFTERDIVRLMKDTGIIRNYPKISGTIDNAKEILTVEKEYGSFRKYLNQLRKEGGEEGMKKQLSKRFSYLGKGTVVIFLLASGEPMPKAMVEWKKQH